MDHIFLILHPTFSDRVYPFFKIKTLKSGQWWLTPFIPSLRGQRQVHPCEFQGLRSEILSKKYTNLKLFLPPPSSSVLLPSSLPRFLRLSHVMEADLELPTLLLPLEF